MFFSIIPIAKKLFTLHAINETTRIYPIILLPY